MSFVFMTILMQLIKVSTVVTPKQLKEVCSDEHDARLLSQGSLCQPTINRINRGEQIMTGLRQVVLFQPSPGTNGILSPQSPVNRGRPWFSLTFKHFSIPLVLFL
jgi:hypothetical protein